MKKVGRAVVYALAVWGFALSLLLVVGFVADIRATDRTSGGYEPPYTGYTGEPIDWEAQDQTNEGLLLRGYVFDWRVDCGTGMISIDMFGGSFDYRELSERAIVVHKPGEACEARGFETGF